MSSNIYVPGITEEQEEQVRLNAKAAQEFVNTKLQDVNQIALIANFLEMQTIQLVQKMVETLDQLDDQFEAKGLSICFSREKLTSERERLCRKIKDIHNSSFAKAAQEEANNAKAEQ